jgi:hypothetical protein
MLAERLHRRAWSIEPVPKLTVPTGQLAAVSCPSATACTAVGFAPTSGSTPATSLAEGWNGTTWSQEPTPPSPAAAPFIPLSSVSCASATDCVAVGGGPSPPVVQAYVWNGSSWTIQSPPYPAGSSNGELDAVSCTSAMACTAAGSAYNGTTPAVTLAEVWDGMSWTVHSTPNLAGSTIKLSGLSCTSATACTAVGSYQGGSSALVALTEVWDGSNWSMQRTPIPTGATLSFLSGVSCTSATACMAVGSFNTTSTSLTLAEVWNGTSWTIERTPNPIGSISSALHGISCTSTTACTAVGYSSRANSPTTEPLIEVWNGTNWAIQNGPNTVGGQLDGVSCTTATACTAVGSSGPNVAALIERHS